MRQCVLFSPSSAISGYAREGFVVTLVAGERTPRMLQRVLNVAAERWGTAEVRINHRIKSKTRRG